MHTCSRVHHKTPFPPFFVDTVGKLHSSEGEKNVALPSFLSLKMFFGKVPSLAAGASLLSCSLSWRCVLEFHGVGTALMRNLDLFLIQ